MRVRILLVSMLFWLFPLSLVSVALDAQESITKFQARMAKLTLTSWGAIPVFIDTNTDVGTFYFLEDIVQEQHRSRGKTCYPGIKLVSADIASITFDSKDWVAVSVALGVPLKQFLAKLSGRVTRKIENSMRLSLENITTSRPYYGYYVLESFPEGGDASKCTDLREYLLGAQTGFLVGTVFSGDFIYRSNIEQKTSIEISAELEAIGFEIGTATARIESGEFGSLVVSGSELVFAVQPDRIDKDRIANLYSYLRDRPSTYRELKLLVDSYLGEKDPTALQNWWASIASFFESNSDLPNTLEEFVSEIFGSEDAKNIESVESDFGPTPPEVLEAAGYVLAAAIIANKDDNR